MQYLSYAARITTWERRIDAIESPPADFVEHRQAPRGWIFENGIRSEVVNL